MSKNLFKQVTWLFLNDAWQSEFRLNITLLGRGGGGINGNEPLNHLNQRNPLIQQMH